MASPYRFLLRMPEELRDKLRATAEAAGRSLNTEIVERLEESLAPARASQSHATSQGRSMRGRSMRLGRIAVVAALVAVTAVMVGVFATSRTHSVSQHRLAKGDSDSSQALKAGIANEGPSATYEAQEEADRAYPAASVPAVAAENSQATFAALKKHGNGSGDWQSIGPTTAQYPAVLDQFLAGGKPYTASGRVTALAVGGCKGNNNKCVIYLGAAGGGIWVAKVGTHDNGKIKWQFSSGAFGLNAIGSLLVDPNDSSGNTVYAATGEENASGDSEAGVGIYKSTDGGGSWTLVPGSDIFTQRSIGKMALDSAGNLLVPIGSGVRGVSSVTGGASSSPSATHPLVTRGLWRQTGSTFTLIWPSPAPARGSTTVKVDPTHPNIIYVNAFQHGIWRSLDNGATFSQIFVEQDDSPATAAAAIDRSEFDVTTLANGATRMYVGEGQGGGAGHQANFWRSDNVNTAATFTQMGGAQVNDYCETQCWYDNYVVTSPDNPNIVYLGGSFDYNTVNASTNGRAVLLSTDGGSTWSDMTRDKDNAGWIHPDQHALVTIPGNPLQFIAGDDGGVVMSDGKYVDGSAQCDTRGLGPNSTAFCKSLLNRIPNQLAVLNQGLSTLQFQSLSVNPQNSNQLMGGTQDNGTFEFTGSTDLWPQIIYGDGGQSGWNATNSNLRFNTFTGEASDVNFRNGDPSSWVIATGPIDASPEGSAFYPPIIADPNPANAGSIFQGSQSVWRTQDWAGNQAFLEANCPEFSTSAANPNCGDFVRVGPVGARDLTAPNSVDPSTTFGTTLNLGTVAAVARTASNSGTMWAATSTGRVFITDNANDPTATAVHWTRLDTSAANAPNRFVSSIVIDPANPNHAWISYSGYAINTPGLPGHVFEVTRTGSTATWVDRTYDLADLPITGLARDDLTGDLYASSDFAVMKLAAGATTWTVAASGMPQVEVAGLTIVPKDRVLYAATHGLGAWKLNLGKVGS